MRYLRRDGRMAVVPSGRRCGGRDHAGDPAGRRATCHRFGTRLYVSRSVLVPGSHRSCVAGARPRALAPGGSHLRSGVRRLRGGHALPETSDRTPASVPRIPPRGVPRRSWFGRARWGVGENESNRRRDRRHCIRDGNHARGSSGARSCGNPLGDGCVWRSACGLACSSAWGFGGSSAPDGISLGDWGSGRVSVMQRAVPTGSFTSDASFWGLCW
jgi:hypothetical protein